MTLRKVWSRVWTEARIAKRGGMVRHLHWRQPGLTHVMCGVLSVTEYNMIDLKVGALYIPTFLTGGLLEDDHVCLDCLREAELLRGVVALQGDTIREVFR